MLLPSFHFLRSRLNGLNDPGVSAATAQVVVHPFDDVWD
jgi:hypothetical protein